jgi:hypothetical protein
LAERPKEGRSGAQGDVITRAIPEVIGETPSEMDRFWLDTAQGMVKESVCALEEVAKQLIGVASLLQGIYFAAISFSDLKKVLIVQDTHGWLLVLLFVSPIIPWLLSVGLAIQVFKPEFYSTNLQSPDLSRKMYDEIVVYKHRYLRYAHWALLAGFILLVINIIVYLGFMPNISTN